MLIFFIGEKEKWRNKGNDKHEDADSLLHNTTSGIHCLYHCYWRERTMERKNGQIKKMISKRMLVLSYTIQLVVSTVCTTIIGEKEQWKEKMDK